MMRAIAVMLAALTMACGAMACSNDTTNNEMNGAEEMGGADASDAGDAMQDMPPAADGGPDGQPDLPEAIECTPGEVLSCREENTPNIDRCNSQGSASEPGTCPASQVCRQGACEQVFCIPNQRQCVGNTGGNPWKHPSSPHLPCSPM